MSSVFSQCLIQFLGHCFLNLLIEIRVIEQLGKRLVVVKKTLGHDVTELVREQRTHEHFGTDDMMNFVMKSKRSRAVLFGVFSLLGILFCIYDLGKGGIYLASAIMYALISIFAGVAAYKMWK